MFIFNVCCATALSLYDDDSLTKARRIYSISAALIAQQKLFYTVCKRINDDDDDDGV